MAQQIDIETIKERIRAGELTVTEANVEMIRAERVRLITGTIPREVRTALNAAVKDGRLGHMKKDGHRPEAFYHPTFEYLAKGERAQCHDRAVNALKRVAGVPV